MAVYVQCPNINQRKDNKIVSIALGFPPFQSACGNVEYLSRKPEKGNTSEGNSFVIGFQKSK